MAPVALATIACIYLFIVGFFLKYAYLNPDGECYAHFEGRHVSDIDDGESINVSEVFHNWFIDCLLLMLLPPLFVLFMVYMALF